MDQLAEILDLARWAPSGDNTQPWRFEVLSSKRFVIHGHDTRESCVYDLDGKSSQLALGALIENIHIAASAFGLGVELSRRAFLADDHPTFDVLLKPEPNTPPSDLLAAIPARSVNRRSFSTRPVSQSDWASLASAVGPDHELRVFAGLAHRLRWASLLWSNAGLRLRLPEAFDVHKRVIEWGARFSADRIPDQALGASSFTLLIMRHAMTSWQRVNFLNTWLAGTIGPRIEMDWLPALACNTHIAIMARSTPTTVDDHIAAGRVIQRFWLTATQLGLQHQPAVTPLVFSRYLRENIEFTTRTPLQSLASKTSNKLDAILKSQTERAVWLGRLGHALPPVSRSERKTLTTLNHLDSGQPRQ
jgi:nitroreductase